MAVYTHISREELDLFTDHYSIENILEFSGIKGGTSNSNYLLKTLEKNYILTIFEERTNQDNLQFFFDLMNHLNKNSVKCPEVIQDKKGNYSNSIQNKKAVITSFLKGRSIDQIKPIHCASLGSTIARMHKESARLEMTRENELGFVNLNSLIQALKNFDDKIDAQVIDLINEEYAFLSGNLGHGLPSGIIHADLFPDNIFFDGNEVTGIIDFYFACTDYYAYEIAICLNAWCFEPNNNEFNPTKAKHLLGSYNQLREFSEEEKKALPLLTRASSLRYLLTRLIDYYSHDDNELIIRKDPNEYLTKLQFHQSVKKVGEYGL